MLHRCLTVTIHRQHRTAVKAGIPIASAASLKAVDKAHASIRYRKAIDVVVSTHDGFGTAARQDLIKKTVILEIGADALVSYTKGILIPLVPAPACSPFAQETVLESMPSLIAARKASR